jgi:hypothetical protein
MIRIQTSEQPDLPHAGRSLREFKPFTPSVVRFMTATAFVGGNWTVYGGCEFAQMESPSRANILSK